MQDINRVLKKSNAAVTFATQDTSDYARGVIMINTQEIRGWADGAMTILLFKNSIEFFLINSITCLESSTTNYVCSTSHAVFDVLSTTADNHTAFTALDRSHFLLTTLRPVHDASPSIVL